MYWTLDDVGDEGDSLYKFIEVADDGSRKELWSTPDQLTAFAGVDEFQKEHGWSDAEASNHIMLVNAT